MQILICTYGRPHKQITYNNFPPHIQKRCIFVVQAREYQQMERLYGYNRIFVLPDTVRTLPDTRQWLHEFQCKGKMVMLDDDLVFNARRRDEPTKFCKMEPRDYERMFHQIEHALNYYNHVGVSHREGANRNTDKSITTSRMMRVLAYNSPFLIEQGVVSNRLPDVEDFDVTLQLLRRGENNYIVNDYVHNQSGSNTEGGCSEYRTLETHSRDVHKLAELHPDHVTVVEKTTKEAWGGGTRHDVRIGWKKAYASRDIPLLDNEEGDRAAGEGDGRTEAVE